MLLSDATMLWSLPWHVLFHPSFRFMFSFVPHCRRLQLCTVFLSGLLDSGLDSKKNKNLNIQHTKCFEVRIWLQEPFDFYLFNVCDAIKKSSADQTWCNICHKAHSQSRGAWERLLEWPPLGNGFKHTIFNVSKTCVVHWRIDWRRSLNTMCKAFRDHKADDITILGHLGDILFHVSI